MSIYELWYGYFEGKLAEVVKPKCEGRLEAVCGRPKGSKNKKTFDREAEARMKERCKVYSREELRKMRIARLTEAEKKRIETMASSFMNEPNLTWKDGE